MTKAELVLVNVLMSIAFLVGNVFPTKAQDKQHGYMKAYGKSLFGYRYSDGSNSYFQPCNSSFEAITFDNKTWSLSRLSCSYFDYDNEGGGPFSETAQGIRLRGELNCGVSTGLAGFASPDDRGEWSGLDVEFCRAVAAAVLGDPTKIKFVPTTSKERFTALQSGEIDILARNTTWTFSRDVQLGFQFVGVNYYDGQGFMAPRNLGVSSALQLDGARVCVQTGTTTELNLADYFGANSMKYTSLPIETNDEARENYINGACEVLTTDASRLAALRSTLPDPSSHIILPEIISKEPLGPVVRHGDNNWGDIVRWTLNAMVIAEEKGVSSSNVDEVKGTTTDPEVMRLLGIDGDLGRQLGLDSEWAYRVIRMVGNYGESFERNVGAKTPLALERGLNQLWSRGGILYSPPMR